MLNIIPYPEKVKVQEKFIYPPYALNKRKQKTGLGDEGYLLKINENGINITAESERAFFYAEKTLNQIKQQYTEKLPFMEIEDRPKYGYRGYMLDVSRHFFSVEEIKKQIDILAELKLNIFHWHLTDDQGWRVQIDKYPKLVETGSKRAETKGDGKPVEGFYTKKEIKEVIDYCSERFIDVVPEIDLPGHFRAAVAAYPDISCKEKTVKVGEGYGIFPDIACAGKESVYQFCYDILDEIVEMFPFKYIHLGGDEALKLNWIDCEYCQKMIKENNLKDEEELQGYFMSEMVKYLNERGKKVINWNDGMLGGNIEGDIAVQYWKESRICKEVVRIEAKKGRQIILSPFFSFYLDYPVGMTPLKKTYCYKIDKEIRKNVIGLEAPLWTEHVPNVKKLEQMTYPRLIAVAEKAWYGENDYEDFLTRLKYFYKILDKRKIGYEKNPNPWLIIGKLQVAKFFINAFSKMEKGTLKAIRKTKKKLKNKYGRNNK